MHDTTACAGKLEARRTANRETQRSLYEASSRLGISSGHSLADRNVFDAIQNIACVVAPETVWSPSGINGKLHRYDVREDQCGVNLYLDISVIDFETCEPPPLRLG